MATEQIAAEVAKEEHSAGMPQLDFSTFPNQIFWLAVALIVIYLVLSRIALPRISSILAERQNTIAGDIAAAEDYRMKAREAEAAYDKALSEARTQAQKIVADMKADMQKQIDAATAKADAEIAERGAASEAKIAEIKAGALVTVEAVAKDAAAEIVAALGGTADANALASAVAARVKG